MKFQIEIFKKLDSIEINEKLFEDYPDLYVFLNY